MIANDCQTLSIVQDKGFQDYTKALSPNYKLPSRKVVSSRVIPEMYNTFAEKLKTVLESTLFVSITTDMWTSVSNKAYLSTTCHFIMSGELKSAMLAIDEFHESHTAFTVFKDWAISSKIVTIISDNGANIKKGISENIKKHHHPCVAHTLNLSVNEAIKKTENLNGLLKKCRFLVGHFKHSVAATEKLQNVQGQMECKQLKLIQDVPTRWN